MRTYAPALPFVRDDEVEVISGRNAGKRGVVDKVAHAESPSQFLVDLQDGTDETLEASALRLVPPAA
jgi:ribosomal protein S4E